MRVWCSREKNNYTAIIEVEENGKKYLMSAGVHLKGLLGQGADIDHSKEFKKISYDSETIKLKKVNLLTNHVFALTENAELYGWGSNDNSLLG